MKKTYYNRILLMYSSVLFCLLIVFVGIYFYQRSAASQDKIEEQDRILFSEYIKQEEGILGNLVTQAHAIRNMDSLASYALSSKENYYSKMTELHNDLSKPGWGQTPIYMIHKINDTRALTTLSSTPVVSQLKIYGIDEDTYWEMLHSLSKSDRENSRFIFSERGILYLTTKTFVNNCMVVTTFCPYADGSTIQEDRISSGFFVQDSQAIDFRDPLAESLPDTVLLEGLDGNYETISSGYSGDCFLMYRRSQYLDMVYYFQREDASFGLLDEAIRLVPLLLMIFIFSFLLIRHLSKKLYAPIDHLVDLFLDMDPDAKAYDSDKEDSRASSEIDYLANQVSKIRSENRTLSQRILEIQTQSRQKFLSALIQGACDEEGIEDDLARYHLEWLDGVNYIVCCCLHNDADKQIAGQIFHIVQEKIEAVFQLLPFPGGDCQDYFIIHTEDKEKLKDALLEVVTLIDTAFSVSMRFYIGKKSCSAVNLQYSFMTIEKIENVRHQLPVSSIYDFSEARSAPSQGTVYPIGTETKLLAAIQKGNYDEMRKTLTYIFQEYLEREFDHPEEREQMAYAFVNTVNRAFLQEGVENAAAFLNMSTFFDELMASSDRGEFEKKLLSVFEKICQLSDQKEESRINSLKLQIEGYISENYSMDISLITISNHFNLTPNYMSSIFKEVMGENFKDYLSRYRFEKIISHLKNDSLSSVSEAGKQAGIHSSTTLTRLFKKFAECSPGQYVTRLRQE